MIQKTYFISAILLVLFSCVSKKSETGKNKTFDGKTFPVVYEKKSSHNKDKYKIMEYKSISATKKVSIKKY